MERLAPAEPLLGTCIEELEALNRGARIYILDLNTFAADKDYPVCIAEERFVVDAKLGIAYLRIGEHDPKLAHKPAYYSVHHKYGTHSPPWFVAQVTNSPFQRIWARAL